MRTLRTIVVAGVVLAFTPVWVAMFVIAVLKAPPAGAVRSLPATGRRVEVELQMERGGL